ncbi:restriction endonuclease subunit S [Leptospira interrogans serovar Canicola]|uniref:Restriction endonuclease subunit S n=1 Tax=Leptospira interrogans serovar Canicola TaxID=211880 RepID=A0AAP9WG14_LEPIR|nr:restriction endonuclease subunit S [Leptospira interrogans]QOI43564.1 restriction endonuclease subunit S [Leptospira interrogans serovar Canicola]
MSQRSFLDQLLDGAKVEWKTLGEVAKILRGASPRPIAKFLTDDENSVPWIRIGDTSTSSKYVINTAQKITFEGAKNSRVLKKGDFIMSNSMSFGRPYILQIDGAIHDGWASISDFEDILYPDYLYYFLTSNSVQTYWTNKINSGSVSNLNLDIIKTLPIPIPPLPVQEEIVRILDAFTELTAELASELTARKKQYNYYRDQLLSFEQGEVEWKTLGETCDVYTGGEAPESSSMSKTPTDIYKYPIFGNGAEVYGYTDRYRIDKDAVTISSIGANTGTIYFRKAHFTPIIRLKVVIPKQEGILPRYLFHALSSIAIGSKSSSVPNMNAADVKRISIPIPPLAEQERIVAILDKFDALTNSISEGLPREIRLRQKQYEHYRELLLSFPKAEVGPT